MLRERLVAGSPRVAQALQQVRRQTAGAPDPRGRAQPGAARHDVVAPAAVRSRLHCATSSSGCSRSSATTASSSTSSSTCEAPPSFIEFGVETYRESNTRFLLVKDNWRGLVIDGSETNVASIRALSEYWRHDLTAVASFITRDNINDLFADAGFTGEVGLLSIDIDGNDYWVWEAIDVVSPVIVVVEYNSVFGPEAQVTVPYAADFTPARRPPLAPVLRRLAGRAVRPGRAQGLRLRREQQQRQQRLLRPYRPAGRPAGARRCRGLRRVALPRVPGRGRQPHPPVGNRPPRRDRSPAGARPPQDDLRPLRDVVQTSETSHY